MTFYMAGCSIFFALQSSHDTQQRGHLYVAADVHAASLKSVRQRCRGVEVPGFAFSRQDKKRAHPDLNQGPADLQSAALTTELCTRVDDVEDASKKTTPSAGSAALGSATTWRDRLSLSVPLLRAMSIARRGPVNRLGF